MTNKRVSLDANILIYAVDKDAGDKQITAIQLIEKCKPRLIKRVNNRRVYQVNHRLVLDHSNHTSYYFYIGYSD